MAILICGICVDLNQIRAGEAATPEESRYTSAFDRIAGRQAREANVAGQPSRGQPSRHMCLLGRPSPSGHGVAGLARPSDIYPTSMFGGCFPTGRRTVLRLTNGSRFSFSRSTVARPMGVLPMISVNPILHAK